MNSYNPPRTRNIFTNGQRFSFSRSKVDAFIKCPKCFYIDRKKGIDVPPGFPFSINSAVDRLLKREFDQYRDTQTVPTLLSDNGINLIPFQHADLETWRENFKGLRVSYQGHEFFGAVDDIWCNKNKELFVVDYKATAASEPVVSIDKDFHSGYKRQVEFYQWLLRKMSFNVSDTAYFVYCTGDNTLPAFNGTIKFHMKLISHQGNTEWVEPTLNRLLSCIESSTMPESGADCDYCKYFNERMKIG
jgi:hypothetical protein